MNHAAQALGRMARGVPKTVTRTDSAARAARLAKARVKRWPKKSAATPKR